MTKFLPKMSNHNSVFFHKIYPMQPFFLMHTLFLDAGDLLSSQTKTWPISSTSLETQHWPGCLSLLPPFTRTWTIFLRNWIFAIEVDPLNLESQNRTLNIPVGLPSSPIKCLRQTSPGVRAGVMIGQTNKHTNRDYNFIYIDDEDNHSQS